MVTTCKYNHRKKDHWISARGCVYSTRYHIVWSTKYRREVLTEKTANDLKLLHEKTAKKKGVTLVTQEIMPDHVHLFITMHPKFSPANIVKIFKGITAKKIFEMHPEIKNKLCQAVSKPLRILQLGNTSFQYFFHFTRNSLIIIDQHNVFAILAKIPLSFQP